VEGLQVGSYRIERTLGTGGFGVVYVGVDLRLGRRAAIKQLLPELSGQHEIVERFFNEAKAAASINHPGIIEIYEVGWHTDGSAYFAMKLLEGDSLGKRLRTSGPMAFSLAATIARQVASALAAAHARGIVHRDLKPDNVVLVPDDEVAIGERAIVLDFGIAKLFGDRPGAQKTRTGMMMGTPAYMSPEQCRGAGEVDHRTDVYALGCILFELLTGRPPFVGEGAGEILGMHQFVAAPSLRGLRPDVSPAFEALVMRTLAKNPAERFQQMSELTVALQPFATGGRAMEQAVSNPPLPRPGSEPAAPVQVAANALQSTFVDAARGQPSTLSGSRGEQLRTPPHVGTAASSSGRRGVVLGAAAAVVIAAGIAAAVVLSGGSPEKRAAAPASAGLGSGSDAAVIAAPEIDAAIVPATAQDAEAPAGGLAAVIADAKTSLADRKWQAAISAAQSALAIDPRNADATRIADTARSESNSEAALRSIANAARDRDPARAKAELASVPETSVYYAQARSAFDNLVADHVKAVTKQARDLAAAGKCKDLSALAQQASGVSAAARKAVESVPCSGDTRPTIEPPPPPARCDFDEAVERGNERTAAGQYAAALAQYEKALRCKQDESIVVKAYVSACNGMNAAKSRAYFKRLPPSKQGQLSQVCVRNGIDLE
jgi:serine/threonine-protein kinase